MHTLLLLVALFAGFSTPADDPLTTKALERIVEIEKLEPTIADGDVQAVNLALNRLEWAAKRLAVVSDKSDKQWIDADARYQAVRKKLEAKGEVVPPEPPGGFDRAKLVQLDKEIRSAYDNLNMLQVKHLQDVSRRKSIEKELAGFDARLAEFPAEHETVAQVARNLGIFRAHFEDMLRQLRQGESTQAADLQRLANIRAKYETQNSPANLTHPFNEEQVRAWCLEMRRWRDRELPTDLAWLGQLAQNPAIDQNAVKSAYHWLTGSFARRLDEVEKLVRERIASDVSTGQTVASFVLETDPSKRDHVLARILGKGRMDEQMISLQDGAHAVRIARVYDEAMGSPAVPGPTLASDAPRPPQPDRASEAALVAKAITHFEKIAATALAEVRMPPAATTDAELLAIAKQTLEQPSYEVGKWLRLVANTDKQHRVRREAWISSGSVSATLTYYEYVWDEFQVTTAEPVGDEIWLYANTLKHYTSGDPTTPLDRWILSRRFQLTPILRENVDK